MTTPLLQMQNITKRFPGVTALQNVSVDLYPAEVHCLLGENGAGKSTLMKILAGAHPPSEGQILLGGKPIQIHSPHHAQQLGISMIYQEFNLSPYLSIAENIFLGREPRIPKTPFIDYPKMNAHARELLARIGIIIDVRKPVNECSVAQQQMIEIAKALSFNAKIIVMDEPSATLTDHEIITLFQLIKELQQQDIGIIYISHRLEEVFQIGDRATILRDGQHIDTQPIQNLTRNTIIQKMVGRELKDEFPKADFHLGPERLRIENLTRHGVFQDVSFTLHQGEIVGLTGLVGAGRTEVARAIFGADPIDAGTIHLDQQPVTINSPRDAIRNGIGLLTEDRKHQGLILGMTLRENTTMANLNALTKFGFIKQRQERQIAQHYTAQLQIKTPSIDQIAQNLSGGNQQKIVLAKWLYTQSKVLIFDEPTRGIDVGAKVEIYKLINSLVQNNVAILIISSELPEILGICTRILVMHEGKLAGQLTQDQATQEKIIRLATGEQPTLTTH